MKKNLEGHMIGPLINKTISRLLITFIIIFIWRRFINIDKNFSVVKDSFFFFGILYLGMAWFNYLKLDKIKSPSIKRSKNKIHIFSREEKVKPADSLGEDEETILALISNLSIGVFFILFSGLGTIFIN